MTLEIERKENAVTTDTKIRLQDHQPSEMREENAPASLDAKLELQDSAVLVQFEDGRSVWIELENDMVRVHHFNRTNENSAPLNVDIPLEGEIEVDTHDYNIELAGAQNDTPSF